MNERTRKEANERLRRLIEHDLYRTPTDHAGERDERRRRIARPGTKGRAGGAMGGGLGGTPGSNGE